MTMTLTTAQWLSSLAHALREAALTGLRKFSCLIEARRNRRAVATLAEFDERMLKDIGLTRAEVSGALEVGFDKDPSALLRRGRPFGAPEPRARRHGGVEQPQPPIVQGYCQGIA